MTDHAAVIREALHTLYAYTSDDANPPGEGRSWSHEQGRAAVAALEQELDALADVAAAGNEREKLLEAELAEAKAENSRLRGQLIDDLQILLGHASIHTTASIYVHTRIADVSARMQAIEMAETAAED